jgi:hypothetical protein
MGTILNYYCISTLRDVGTVMEKQKSKFRMDFYPIPKSPFI